MSYTPPFNSLIEISDNDIEVIDFTVTSNKEGKDCIEIADEFFQELFIPAVNNQLFNPDPSLSKHKIELLSSKYISSEKALKYSFRTTSVPIKSYSILLNLIFQAILLEEPISEFKLISTSQKRNLINIEELNQQWLDTDIPPKLPFDVELEWNLFDAYKNGLIVNFSFQAPPKKEDALHLKEMLILWNNFYFTYAFQFDFSKQETHFPVPGTFKQLGPSLFVYLVPPIESHAVDDYEQALFPLFNIANYYHIKYGKINNLIIEG